MTADRFKFLEFPDEGADKASEAPSMPEKKEPPGKGPSDYLKEADEKFWEGDFEEALLRYSKALRLDPALIPAWEGQVRCLTSLDEFREAEIWAKKALGLHPKNAGLLSASAVVEALAGRYDEAMQASDSAVALSGGDERVFWLDRGTVLLLKGNEDTARLNFEKVFEKNPEWPFLVRVALAYLRVGKGTVALSLLTKAAEASPGVPFIWYKLGQAHLLGGNQPKARACFEKALELRPNYRPAGDALSGLQRKACFVATCLELDEERLDFLRHFRDRMRSFGFGELLWRLYCRVSPPLVNFLVGRPAVKKRLRRLLEGWTDFMRRK